MSVDESMKAWRRRMTQDEYDLHVLTSSEYRVTYKVSEEEYLRRLAALEQK